MKIKFSFLVALSAIAVAGCAAYYSVFGLSQLFAGASLAVIIMASSLEFSKIIAVSFLHRYWKKISGFLKFYLTIGVFILVCITSAGIYGFLSNAYQKTASKLEISEGQMSLINGKKELFQKNIGDNQNIINTKTARLQQLSNLREVQESRLDGAKSNTEKNRMRNDIINATKEIQKLNDEIDGLNIKNTSSSDSVNFYSNKMIESKANDATAGEVGPLKYLAQLTGYPMDKVVNWFILLLIFVFDPLAVSLVIATNKALELESEKNEQPKPSIISKKKRNIFGPILNSLKKSRDSIKRAFEPKLKEPKIEDKKFDTNRGFSVDIPVIKVESANEIEKPTEQLENEEHTIQTLGTNKFFKDNDATKVFFKRRDR